MKKLIPIVAAAALLTACGGGTTTAKVVSTCTETSVGGAQDAKNHAICQCVITRAAARGRDLDTIEQELKAKPPRNDLGNDRAFVYAIQFCATHNDHAR